MTRHRIDTRTTSRLRRRHGSIHLGQIEEDDHGRIAHRSIVARESEAARRAIHLKDGDTVGSLIAAVKELARRVEAEAARIITSRPFFAQEGQLAVGTNGKDADAVVQSVARINEFPVVRNENLRAKIRARKLGRQRRDCLPTRQSANPRLPRQRRRLKRIEIEDYAQTLRRKSRPRRFARNIGLYSAN